MLLQIAEPGQSAKPHERKVAIGIDLGTSNSVVATVRSSEAVVLGDEEGDSICPSVVHYAASGEALIGKNATPFLLQDPANTVCSIKRLMGRGIEDSQSLGRDLPYTFVEKEGSAVPFIKTAAGDFSPIQISSHILKRLKNIGELSLLGGSSSEIDGAVITVPAYFDEAQRQATKDAATLAGLNVLRLLNEPTAAAVAYGLDKQAEGLIAVYDLGGGTFDVSILRLSKGVFEVLATGGDSALGGDDFDQLLVEWLRDQEPAARDFESRELLLKARAAKEALAEHQSVNIDLGEASIVLSQEQLASLLSPLINRSIKSCRRALRDADVAADEIDNVILVGGSTRTLAVRAAVAELFECEPLADLDPDRVVALGAALQADVLVGNKPDSEMLLLDVIPLSLGIETMGGLVEQIITRNSPIPVAKAQEFTTFKDGQTAMALHVLQGERDLVSACRSLARFELRGIPPMVAGAAKIRVVFQVDADGLLTVTAQELNSGVKTSVDIKPSYGLADDDISRMLQESFSNAEGDMKARALREQQVEAERVLEALVPALEADAGLLSPTEHQTIVEAMEALLMQRQNAESPRDIEAAIETLAACTDDFAARRMDKSIKQALAGQSLDDIDS